MYLPSHLREEFDFVTKSSPPQVFTEVHGYDRTGYNVAASDVQNHDNVATVGVFSGWTASNMVASPSAVADLTWEIYREHYMAPQEYVAMMTEGSKLKKYGLATQINRNIMGQQGRYGESYGHFGATYGYQSIIQYFPELDFVITIASNIEVEYEPQIKDSICFAYNEVAALLLGRDEMTCSCDCSPDCHCHCSPLGEPATSGQFTSAVPKSDGILV